jgi:hypothetical protein
MRNIILITVVFVLGSCTDRGPCVTETATIINKSNREIILMSYQYDINTNKYNFSNKFTLKNNDIIYGENEGCPPNVGYIDLNGLVIGDSILIDYGDKIKSYSGRTIDTDMRNPYRLDSENKSRDFTYTLTPEDYANATKK